MLDEWVLFDWRLRSGVGVWGAVGEGVGFGVGCRCGGAAGCAHDLGEEFGEVSEGGQQAGAKIICDGERDGGGGPVGDGRFGDEREEAAVVAGVRERALEELGLRARGLGGCGGRLCCGRVRLGLGGAGGCCWCWRFALPRRGRGEFAGRWRSRRVYFFAAESPTARLPLTMAVISASFSVIARRTMRASKSARGTAEDLAARWTFSQSAIM